MNRKNPGLAGVFSFFIPGLGQVYNGQFTKALGFVLGSLVGAALSPAIVGIFIYVPLWVWAIMDAYHSARTVSGHEGCAHCAGGD